MSLGLVIPTYNHARYLAATIESALTQAVPFDEVIVSDNLSTDETAEVLAAFDGRIRVIRPAVHLPMSRHWNFAFGAVESDWGVLMSSDDLAASEMSEVLRRGIARDAAAVYVRGAHDTIDDEGRRLARRYLLSVRGLVHPPQTLLEQLDGPKAVLCAGAVRMKAWRAVGGFPEQCTLLGDWGLWLRLSPHGSFVYERKVIAGYRVGHQDAFVAARALRYVRDLIAIDREIIPATARAVGIVADDPRLTAAAARRLLRLLAFLGQEASPEVCRTAAEELRPWAVRVGAHEDLARLSEGAPPPTRSGRRLRRIVAPPLRAAYTWWRQ